MIKDQLGLAVVTALVGVGIVGWMAVQQSITYTPQASGPSCGPEKSMICMLSDSDLAEI